MIPDSISISLMENNWIKGILMEYPEKGVFSKSDLQDLITHGRVEVLPGFEEKHVGPASIDITVSGGEVYKVGQLLRPSGKRREKVRDMLALLGAKPVRMGDVLGVGHKYVAKATVNCNFPVGLYGYSNAKSTSGRNMCLCRTIADEIEGYDTLDRRWENWSGEVWLTIEPFVFPIVLTDKECYAQVRIFDGDTRFREEDLKRELQKQDFLFRQDGTRYKMGELELATGDGTIFTTLYAKAGKLVGFRAKRTLNPPLDLTARGLHPENHFIPVYAEEDPTDQAGGMVTLEPGYFYLFSTNEMLDVPEHLCAELVAIHPRLGLFFSHFAGFFDPGFMGVPTLEVTAIIQTTLRHREAVGCFRYERMRSKTASYALTGNYSGQKRTTLPKQFVMPGEWRDAMA
jgi:deoxycytidine triphosphate deaminase